MIYDLLTTFEQLEELNLSDNKFTQLPEDLSQLKTISNLNLTGIQFDDFTSAIASIATMPALRSIYINLQEESQVDIIMSSLPELEYLNGIPVDRDIVHETGNQNPNGQSATALAIQKEVSVNVGDQVNELPEEEEDSNTESIVERDV